jgi:hypothetical protein
MQRLWSLGSLPPVGVGQLFKRDPDAMKLTAIILVGLAAAFLSGCRMTPKENYQQTIDADLGQATTAMLALRAFDSGDVVKARRTAMVPVFLNLDATRYYAVKGMVRLTHSQKEEWTKIARETLDYMCMHRGDWDPRLLDFQAGMRGLRYFLTQADEVQRLDELSEYLARVEQKKPEAHRP